MNAAEPRATPSPAETVAAPGTQPQRGLDDLYDIGRLADRLGVEHATIRVWLSRKVPWLPAPDGRLNGGAVWRATTLENIETRRTPGRPGRKPRVSIDGAAAPVATHASRPASPARPDGSEGADGPAEQGPTDAANASSPVTGRSRPAVRRA